MLEHRLQAVICLWLVTFVLFSVLTLSPLLLQEAWSCKCHVTVAVSSGTHIFFYLFSLISCLNAFSQRISIFILKYKISSQYSFCSCLYCLMFYVIWNVLGCPATVHYVPYFTQTFVAELPESIFLLILICIHQYYGFRVWGTGGCSLRGNLDVCSSAIYSWGHILVKDLSSKAKPKLRCPKRNGTDPSTKEGSCTKKDGDKQILSLHRN